LLCGFLGTLNAHRIYVATIPSDGLKRVPRPKTLLEQMAEIEANGAGERQIQSRKGDQRKRPRTKSLRSPLY